MQYTAFVMTVTSARAVLLALAMVACCAMSLSAQSTQASKRVLMVFTHQSENPAQAGIEQAMRSALQSNSSMPVETYSEYLDAVRTPVDGYEKELVSELQRKYAGKNFDLLFALNPPALKLLTKNRAALFPNAPIVYLVIDQQNLNDVQVGPNMTGVWGEVDYKATAELALTLHPGTKQLVVISGVDDWDNYWRSIVQERLRPFQAHVSISYLTGLTIAELQKALANLLPHTVVLFVSSTRDHAGNTPGNLTVISQICPAANAPIYGTSGAAVGVGMVGGRVVSFDALGTEAAHVGLRVISGEKPEVIGPHGVPSVAMFDARELKRWGISERSLPPGAIVKFKDTSLWEEYKWIIIALIVAVIVEGLLIGRMLYGDRRRRHAEQKTKWADRRLREIVSNVPGMVWETVINPETKERKTTFVSEYVRTMLGYTPEEWLAQPPGFGLRIMPDEDRERMQADTEAAIAYGENAVSEHRWRAKDGRLVWIESHLSPIVDGGGEAAGLRGVSLDITERKLAEETAQHTEERARALLEAIPDLMFLQTADGVFLDYHATNEESLYLSPKEFMGKTMRETLPPALGEMFAQNFKRTIETGETQIVEYALPMPDGPHWYEARLVSTEGNILSVVRDITDRQLAEAALKDSELNYRSIFNAANDAMFVHDLKTGAVLDVNQRACEMYNCTVEDARQLTIADFSSNVPPYTDKEASELVQKAAGGTPQLFEWHAKKLTGELFWVEVSLRRVSISGNDCVLAIVRDITERKRAHDELRQSEQRFGKAFQANPQPMSITRIVDGLYLDVNESFLGLSGYARDEVIGHTSLELKIWETPEARKEFIQKLTQHGSVVNHEMRFRTKNGSFRTFLSSAERLDLGGEECLLVASSDITERMAAQQALTESEARFRNMADTAPVLIWMSNTENRCIYVNQQWVDFTGRTIDQELGGGWTDGIYPDDHERCVTTYAEAFNRREPFQLEYRLRRFDGQYRWVMDTGTPRLSSTGKFLGYIGSCVDITDRKESEIAVASAHKELVIAHDEVQRLKAQLEEENIYLQEEIRQAKNLGEMVGESDAIKYVMFKVSHVAVTDSTVLITGETGTGKELVARAIHSASARSERSLITVNCAALPATLIESELFGHEKGAFTGAAARKPGRFELADGGTIFLDEVGELPLESQVKLLRVIQEGEIQRLGGANPIKVNVRIIAATNRNLKREIERGTFREDLWYRLNVFPITVPPLRQRKEDIPLLVEHFVANYANKFGRTITSIGPKAMQKLKEHSWPGNVRELANVIERAVIYTQGNVLSVVDIFEQPKETADDSSAMKSLEEVEREYILHILEHTSWRIEGPQGAAKLLGLNPSTLRTRMIKLGIHKNNNASKVISH